MWDLLFDACRYIPNVEILFIFLGASGFVVSLVINYLDFNYHDSILNKPELTSAQINRITSKSKSGSFSRLLNAVKARSYNSMEGLHGHKAGAGDSHDFDLGLGMEMPSSK